MLRVEGIGYNVGKHHEIHSRYCEHYGQKISYFIYIFELEVIGKHDRKDVG
jgi:hypothetical protein